MPSNCSVSPPKVLAISTWLMRPAFLKYTYVTLLIERWLRPYAMRIGLSRAGIMGCVMSEPWGTMAGLRGRSRGVISGGGGGWGVGGVFSTVIMSAQVVTVPHHFATVKLWSPSMPQKPVKRRMPGFVFCFSISTDVLFTVINNYTLLVNLPGLMIFIEILAVFLPYCTVRICKERWQLLCDWLAVAI